MKFLYGYKTHENETREGVISAPSRDAAYRELKAQGIKPFKVVLAPGFGNWLSSLGKRVYAIVVLCALCLALCAVVVRTKHEVRVSINEGSGPLPRHQIYGDPALMDELERTGYTTVFAKPGDALLARFAQPGQVVKRETGRARIEELKRDAEALAATIAVPDSEAVALADSDAREVRELKRSVLWMRGELRDYLANGIGTPERYVRRLVERQEREAQVYFTAQNDLKGERRRERWEHVNESLRAMGLKTIPVPVDAHLEGAENPVADLGGKN